MPYITSGIDQAITRIDSVIKQLESLSTDIKNTASAIKREDDAAAAAARAKALEIKNMVYSYNEPLLLKKFFCAFLGDMISLRCT